VCIISHGDAIIVICRYAHMTFRWALKNIESAVSKFVHTEVFVYFHRLLDTSNMQACHRKLIFGLQTNSRSQWPRGLRHRYLCVYSVFVLSCV
jgi:hypothetical protein